MIIEGSFRSLPITRSQEDRKVWVLFGCPFSALRHIPGSGCISTDGLPIHCGSRNIILFPCPSNQGVECFLIIGSFWLLQLLLVIALKPTLLLYVACLLKTLLPNSPELNSVFCWNSDSLRQFLPQRNLYFYGVKFSNFNFFAFLFIVILWKAFPSFR